MSSTPTPDFRSAPLALFAAPHRAMFLAGGVQAVLVFCLWAVEIAARAGIVPAFPWALPAGWMHAFLVVGGVFPFFIFGFLFTAMPRWQGQGDLPAATWTWAWRLLAVGWGVIMLGVWNPGIVAVGLVAVLLGWARAALVLWRVAHGEHQDRMHARLTWWGLAAGGLSLLAWLIAILGADGRWARVAIELGVWGFLLPVFFTVCHRMVPFFSSSVVQGYVMVRPRWALTVIIGGAMLHGLLAVLELRAWSWLADVPVAVTALWLSWKWQMRPALQVRLLGMLHIGFAWLGLALALSAVQSLAAMMGWHGMGLAPLHALGIGFFASILFSMVSRVSLGHSGRPLAADDLTWWLFLALQGVAVLRVLADLVPAFLSRWLMFAAAIGWLLVFGSWAVRYLPMYWRPRVDGRPG